MHPQTRLSLFAISLLLISAGNLYGIGLALWYRNSDALTSSDALPDKWGTMAIVFLACSQALYLLFFFAWLFQWVHFYPGNPLQTISIACGFSLSAAALLTASIGLGLKRLMGIIIAITTGLLWLISAVGSVAV
jgi:hypothetical protein